MAELKIKVSGPECLILHFAFAAFAEAASKL
jgi:hypothetical protein